MDPFTFTVILLGGVGLGGYVLIKNIPNIIGASYGHHKKVQEKKQEKLESTPEYQEKLIHDRQIENALDKTKNMNFVNVKDSKDLFSMRLREEFQFDIDKDIVLKGTLRCKDKVQNPVEMPIYLYQPRLFGSRPGTNEEVCIGPIKKSNGKLNKKYMYLVKKPGVANQTYYGYVPKAEISTGDEYDFDKDNDFNSNYRIFDYINITFDYDANGDILPVNLNDPAERKQVLDYIAKYKDTNVFYEYARIANKSLQDEIERERQERLRAEAEYERDREAARRQASENKPKENKVDSETEKYKEYYNEMYGHFGQKSFYNKLDEVRKANGEPPVAPPPPPPHDHHGPRR